MLERAKRTVADASSRVWPMLQSSRISRDLARGVLFSRLSRPFAELEIGDGPEVRDVAAPWRSMEQHEHVTVLRRGVFVEPDIGWLIGRPCHLVRDCLIDGDYARRPTLTAYLLARLKGAQRVRPVKSIVTLRDGGEGNYWHFLNDLVGGRLRLAAACGIDENTPLVVGRRLFERRFFQEFMERSTFCKRPVIVQNDEFLYASEVFFFQTARHSLENVAFTRKTLGVPDSDPRTSRRILVARAARVGRQIANMEEVEKLCRGYGFDVVAMEGMSLDEQIRLFGEARHVIGVHGAGLANLIFRQNAPLHMLEIFPPREYLLRGICPPHYCWLSHALGFGYDAVLGAPIGEGSARSARSPFQVDMKVLDQKLQGMLAARDAVSANS